MTEFYNTVIITPADFAKFQKNGMLVLTQMESFNLPFTDLIGGYKVTRTYLVMENIGNVVCVNTELRESNISGENPSMKARRTYMTDWQKIKKNFGYVGNPYMINNAYFNNHDKDTVVTVDYGIIQPVGSKEQVNDTITCNCVQDNIRYIKIIPVEQSYNGKRIQSKSVQCDFRFKTNEEARSFYLEMLLLENMNKFYPRFQEYQRIIGDM
jgi:hypothetical protein